MTEQISAAEAVKAAGKGETGRKRLVFKLAHWAPLGSINVAGVTLAKQTQALDYKTGVGPTISGAINLVTRSELEAFRASARSKALRVETGQWQDPQGRGSRVDLGRVSARGDDRPLLVDETAARGAQSLAEQGNAFEIYEQDDTGSRLVSLAQALASFETPKVKAKA